MLKKGKIIIYALWALTVLSFIIACVLYPEIISPEYLVGFIKKFNTEVLFIYILITLIRGFFLIPSTPFVIIGVLLFPTKPFLVLSISMIGILFSSTMLYYFSDILGFSGYLERKVPEKIEKWKQQLTTSKSTFFIAAWALFPFVPTDIICYITGIIKIPFKNMLIGIFIGELILVTFYVFFGSNLIKCISLN